ncbi:diphthine--ammonia ligase [Bacillus sp. FJAT-27445]|uniref:Dph6-related ATP pyrophosphatase n=1 Tax=Bacillus sp. FJAT-27445 TaxID=1679166 RepID=UPI0007433A3B|nr:diphthine--ammonia ligase [Bacillus sp. FJAT-27445]
MKERIAVSWSGGKDSCFALYKLLQSDEYIVDSLFTTITEEYSRVSIHGVRESLLEMQADSIGFPLRKLYIPAECSNEVYQERMRGMLESLKKDGVTAVMFGDILLNDVKEYRENQVREHGLKGVFPLWEQSTEDLIKEFLSLGFKTITTCIDTEKLDDRFLGRVIDNEFLNVLPSTVDPCGENGEFHTFCFAGPLFNGKVDFTICEEVDKGRFHFCDLL